MTASNQKYNYTVARVFHWIAAAIIIFNLLSGWRLDSFPLDTKVLLVMVHSGVGTTIFALMLFRWWWRRAHNLYAPPRWWKRPSMLLQWVFYPLVLIQVLIGVANAAFIDYPVLGFGFIPYSSLADDKKNLHAVFLQMHTIMAWLLITLVVVHGIERWRLIFVDDPEPEVVRNPVNT
ncbi:MAG: cytochrome b/b6 domain-containing protein [Gammaproteobacteria bacterium]